MALGELEEIRERSEDLDVGIQVHDRRVTQVEEVLEEVRLQCRRQLGDVVVRRHLGHRGVVECEVLEPVGVKPEVIDDVGGLGVDDEHGDVDVGMVAPK